MIRATWSLVGLLAVATVAAAADANPPRDLRLSWTGPPTRSMTVVWQTPQPAPESFVEYGLTSALGRRAAVRPVSYEYQTGFLHEATLEGLDPGRRYFYRAGSGAGWSEASSFQTAPEGRRDFVFTAFGDHGVGDVSRQNVERVAAEKPAFHLILGDLSYANGNQPVWDAWFAQLEPLARLIPVMPAPGNHENETIQGKKVGYAAFLARLALPPPETHYWFDYGAARFVCYNSDNFRDPAERAWLVDALQKARADRRVRWIIVYQHHPLYSSNVRRLNNVPLIESVRSVYDEYRVDLVLAGHNHNYERSYPLVGDKVAATGAGRYKKGRGVVFVVSGGGGKSLYEFVPEVPAITARRESVPHYLKVKVGGRQISVEALRTSDRSLLDAFTIER